MKFPIDYARATWQERRDARNIYVGLQGGRCYYCHELLAGNPKNKPKIDWSKFPKGFMDHPIHLHHSHKTGMTIGAVHAYCNAILWQYHGE